MKLYDRTVSRANSKRIMLVLRNQLLLSVLVSVSLSACTVVPGLDLTSGSHLSGAPTGIGGIDFVEVGPSEIVKISTQETPLDFGGKYFSLDELGDEEASGRYIIGPGDVLSIIVWGHPELTNPAGDFRDPESTGRLVNSDGKIFYPYIGDVRVSGLNVSQVRGIIASNLARVVRDPQVDVRVAAFRSQSVKVVGEVSNSVLVPITDRPLTIIEALARAGGINEGANKSTVILVRENKEYLINLHARTERGIVGGEVILRDDDVVRIPENRRNRVFMFGAVGTQTSVPMVSSELSLADALSSVKGLSSGGADQRAIYVIRSVENPSDLANPERRTVVYHLKFDNVASLVMSEQFLLWPRDLVYVDRTGLATYNSVVSQILPTVSTLFQLDRLTD